MGPGHSDGATDASGTGDDILRGYAGNDTMDGGSGNDRLEGGDGNDSVLGGDGNDTLWGGNDRDTLLGGLGDDVFLAYASDGDNGFLGGDGTDRILAMVDGANVGIDGNFDATNSIEVIDANGFANVSIYSVDAQAAFLDFSGPTLIDIAGIYGESNNDTIIGSLSADVIHGGTGDDSLDGGAGADTFGIEDGFGADTILGGEGGIDADTIHLAALTNAVSVIYNGDEAGTITDGVGTIDFSVIERIVFTELDDIADASATTTGVTIDGGESADSITGGDGDDHLIGDGTGPGAGPPFSGATRPLRQLRSPADRRRSTGSRSTTSAPEPATASTNRTGWTASTPATAPQTRTARSTWTMRAS